VVPDMITFAKGITSGAIPMGGVMVRQHIYDAFMNGPDHVIELFHGYTYSGHPIAAAAGVATLETYKEEGLFERALKLEDKWADAAMSLKGKPHVADIRTIGLVAGIDLDPIQGTPGKRAYDAMEKGFHDHGIMLRITGDTIALSPPLIIKEEQIAEIFEDKLPKILAAI
jgi:beta-alanine--pyruvate transaminase